MGCCLSKTNPILQPPLSNSEPQSKLPDKTPPPKLENVTKITAVAATENKEEEQILEKEELVIKDKEEFVIQPRKSNDKRPEPKQLRSDSSDPESTDNPQIVATKIMEMAASGAVVRTSSCTKEEVDAILIQCGRLSRSSSGKCANSSSNRKYSGSKRSHDFDKESVPIELNNCDENEDDERQRRRQSRGSHRRTTPSRSRERDPKSSGGGRRLSQSPRKRSEATSSNNNPSTTSSNGGGGGGNNRPGKLVSVPATVSSLSVEKSNNGEGANTSNVKRVLVRRNVTPPRSRSPARSAVVKSTNQNQPSPNRNASRKTEHSPYRRTPLTDLDMNSLTFQPLANKSTSIKSHQTQSKMGGGVQGSHGRARSRGGEGSELGAENLSLGPAIITRTRSQRRSRDLDAESLSNPATNYTSLLLQDIQNFHQKGSTSTGTSTSNVASFKLPECVSKACSIVEAVADLTLNSSSTTRTVGGRGKDDDLMELSLQKFVTVGKGKEFDEREESSGSNSVVVGSQNQWVSSSASSWEMSSEGVSPASFQRIATSSRSGGGMFQGGNSEMNKKKGLLVV